MRPNYRSQRTHRGTCRSTRRPARRRTTGMSRHLAGDWASPNEAARNQNHGNVNAAESDPEREVGEPPKIVEAKAFDELHAAISSGSRTGSLSER